MTTTTTTMVVMMTMMMMRNISRRKDRRFGELTDEFPDMVTTAILPDIGPVLESSVSVRQSSFGIIAAKRLTRP